MELLDFSTELTDIVFTAKPNFRLCITYGTPVFTMQTASCLLDTKACVSLTSSSMIHPGWTDRIKCTNVPQLQTETKQTLSLDKLILLHLCLGKLSTRIGLGVAPHLAHEILFDTSFIDHSSATFFLLGT